MSLQKLYSDKSYGLLLASIESKKASNLNNTIGYISSGIADIMSNYYSIDDKKIASYEHIIQQYNFTTKKDKIHALKLVAEYGITIDCLKVICNTHYGSNYKKLVQSCGLAPGMLQINADTLGFLLTMCIQENIHIKTIQRDKVYTTSPTAYITKEKIELLYQIYGAKELISGIHTGALYYIQHMDIEQIKERIKKHPEIHINTLNYIAQIEHEVATQKLYMSNVNERNEPGY